MTGESVVPEHESSHGISTVAMFHYTHACTHTLVSPLKHKDGAVKFSVFKTLDYGLLAVQYLCNGKHRKDC